MSSILNWISTNLFKSTNPEQKTITDQTDKTGQTEKTEQTDNSDGIKKWIPNDKLWRRYNEFLETMSIIQRKKHSESKLIAQSKHLIKQYKMESVSDDITSKMNAIQTKQQLMSVESDIKRVQSAIKELELLDPKILDEWNEYLDSAREFLVANELDSFIDVNDILCTQNLFVTMKKNFDSYYTSNNSNKDKIEQIAQMTIYFDTSKTQNYAKITNKEFEAKKKELLDKVKFAHIVDDLSKPFDPRKIGLAHNDVNIINNNILQITGPTQISIPEARLINDTDNLDSTHIPEAVVTIGENK